MGAAGSTEGGSIVCCYKLVKYSTNIRAVNSKILQQEAAMSENPKCLTDQVKCRIFTFHCLVYG